MAFQTHEKTVETQANAKITTKSITVPPPDGGWGWVVVFSSFMIQAITNGAAYSFGLFFTKITHSAEISASKSDASWIGSIMLGVSLGAGLVASVFLNRFGCRAVCIVGSLIASFGFGISYWANGVLYLYISVGIMGGLGLGLSFLPVVVCVSHYFEKRRSFATGIAICGSGFGTFALAPILDFLISWLGWRAAFLGVAAINFLCVPLAALLRPLPTITVTTETETSSDNLKPQQATSTKLGKINPNFVSSVDNTLDVENQNPHNSVLKSENSQNLKYQDSNVNNDHKNENTRVKNESNSNKLFDLCLFRNPIFLFFLLSNFLTNIGAYVPYVYYADMARDILKTKEGDPALGWLVSSMGIASIFSRIVLCYLSDTKYVNRLYVYGGSLVLCGMATTLSAYGSSLTYLAICAVIFGGSGGIYTAITSVILVDLLGLDKLSNSYGIVLFLRGVASLIGPPIVGLLFDTYKNYTFGFWFAGISVTLGGFMMFVIPSLVIFLARKP